MRHRAVLGCCLLLTSATHALAQGPAKPAPSCRAFVQNLQPQSAMLIADEAGTVQTATFSLCLEHCPAGFTLTPHFGDLVPVGAPDAVALGAEIGLTKGATIGSCTDYTLKIGRVWDTGEFRTTLFSGDQAIKTFAVVRTRAAFTLTVDPAPATVHAVAGRVRVPVNNADLAGYHVRWKLMVGDQECRPDPPATATADIGSKSTATLSCTLTKRGLSAFLLGGTLKDETEKGVLTIEAVQKPAETPGGSRPRKDIPIAVAMSYFDEPRQSVASVVSITILLMLGGVVSLLMGAAIPTIMRRAKLRLRLRAIRQKTANALDGIDPMLGTALDVERRRIQDLAESESWLSPDATDNLTVAESALDHLEQRADFITQLTPALRLAHSIRGGGLPPTLLQTVEDTCRTAGLILRKTVLADADPGNLGNIVAACTQASAGAGQPDAAFAADLVAREAALRAIISQADSPIVPKMVNCRDWLTAVAAAPPSVDPMEYTKRDTIAVKLGLVVAYIRLKDPDLEGLPAFVESLHHSEWTVLRDARRLLSEIVDGVDANAIEAALLANKLQIVFSLDDPAALDSLTISACFTDAAMNRAAARAHFEPVWTFGHGAYRETGWDVRHFFPGAKAVQRYAVSVTFMKAGRPLKNGNTDVTFSRTVSIRPPVRVSRKRVWLQVARTGLLMVLSAVALQKTALAALAANTNFISVAMGVFSMGFVIDTVKGGFDALRARI